MAYVVLNWPKILWKKFHDECSHQSNGIITLDNNPTQFGEEFPLEMSLVCPSTMYFIVNFISNALGTSMCPLCKSKSNAI